LLSAAGVALWAALAGCGCVPSGTVPTPSTDGNVGIDPASYPTLRVAGEPNDTFTEPVDVVLDAQGRGTLSGLILTPDDVDVYALHGLQAGDRLIVDVAAHGSGLDAVAAVFDEAGRILFENDDRNVEALQLDPYINDVIRRDSTVYFLALSRAPLADEGAIGSYEVLITVVFGGQVPAPLGQTVVLDFDGGTITMPSGKSYTVGPFDAGDIDPVYAGQTAAVRAQVAETVRENYEGLALDVRVIPDEALPVGVSYSCILFGGRDLGILGIAQQVDSYNRTTDDSAIVFTDMFTPSLFGRTLTVQQLGVAIGNVASHELGHLLGLNHVANVADLMDTTGGAETLLADQEFLNSPLDDTIFPIGMQDSWLLLLETLGWSP